MFNLHKCRVGIVGLGYVGLPLAVEFGRHFDTVGFDVKPKRIRELKVGRDSTREASPQELRSASRLQFTTRLQDLKACGVMVVTVPTPIDEFKRPELTPLMRASESIGKVLKKGDVVVYESTVCPDCTEEVWWHDKIDWIGGYPFEVSKPEQIFDFYKNLGYSLKALKTCGGSLGCNEFVFQRDN
jgi:UDP-N-acetyl-D-galactosamine dehydrogenase